MGNSPVHGVTPVALGRDGWCDPFARTTARAVTYCVHSSRARRARSLKSEQHYAMDEVVGRMATPRPTRVLRALYELLRPHLSAGR